MGSVSSISSSHVTLRNNAEFSLGKISSDSSKYDIEGRGEFFDSLVKTQKSKSLTEEGLASAISDYTIEGKYLADGKDAKQLENFAGAFDIDVNNPKFKAILAATDKFTDKKGRTQYNIQSLAHQIFKAYDCEANGIDKNSFLKMIYELSNDKAAEEKAKLPKVTSGANRERIVGAKPADKVLPAVVKKDKKRALPTKPEIETMVRKTVPATDRVRTVKN